MNGRYQVPCHLVSAKSGALVQECFQSMAARILARAVAESQLTSAAAQQKQATPKSFSGFAALLLNRSTWFDEIAFPTLLCVLFRW
jgi:hypothetical protein